MLDVQFLPDVGIPCPDCNGTRYRPDADAIRISTAQGDRSLPAFLSTPVADAADMLADLDATLHQAGMDLFFAEMKGPVKDRLKRYGLFNRLGIENFFPTIEQAVERYLAVYKISRSVSEKENDIR